MKVSYYPGCSLEGTARDYSDSIHAVCDTLEIELQEVPDWNCCGASAAHSINHGASIELSSRVLKMAEKLGKQDLLVPCPLCFNRLKTALHPKGNGSSTEREDREESPGIWDLASWFSSDEMLCRLASKVEKPLRGLKVVCYYGCLASRPPGVTGAKDYENPQSIDRILKTLGATSFDWPYKTDCCGGSLIKSRPEMAHKMIGKILRMARRVGAQAVVVSCQMCQINLDMFQEKIEQELEKRFGLPIIYFTELIGLACGAPGAESWLSRHFVDPAPLLKRSRLL